MILLRENKFQGNKYGAGGLLIPNPKTFLHGYRKAVNKAGIDTYYSEKLTKALEMQLTHPGPVKGKGLVNRCKRCAYVIDDCIVKAIAVAEKEDDPAGDDYPELTMVDNMLKLCYSL